MLENAEWLHADPKAYTWEQFIVELQLTVPFYFVFFVRRAPDPREGSRPVLTVALGTAQVATAPDIAAAMEPGYDARKRDLLHEMTNRAKVDEGGAANLHYH